jgi:hypothetical protein
MNPGTNGLPISPDAYVTDPPFRRIGDAIAAHGVAVEYVEFSIFRAFGGASGVPPRRSGANEYRSERQRRS